MQWEVCGLKIFPQEQSLDHQPFHIDHPDDNNFRPALAWCGLDAGHKTTELLGLKPSRGEDGREHWETAGN